MPERRKLPRPKSLLTVIEDITYTVLRAHSASTRNPDGPNEPEQRGNVLNENGCGSRRSNLQRRRHCIRVCGQRFTGKRFWHRKDNRSDVRHCCP